MTPWDLISALFYPVDEQLHALPKHPERRTSGPVRWAPWACCMLAKAGGTGRSIAG